MKEEKPYQYIIPYSKCGKWSIVFIVLFTICLITFYWLVDSGQRGGDGGYFGNLWLAIPLTSAVLFGNASFFTGLFAAIKQGERSMFVLTSILIGLVVCLWTLAYIIPFE